MSVSSGQSATWANVTALYTALNTARSKWSFSAVTIPGNPGAIDNANISTLESYINAMQSNSKLKTVAVSNNTPTEGTLIYPSTLNNIETVISNIQSTDNHNNNNSYNAAGQGNTYYGGQNGFT